MASFQNCDIAYFQFKHLLNLTDKKLVKFKDAHGKNRANKTYPGARETWTHVVGTLNPPQMFFYQWPFKNDSFVSKRDLAIRENINFLLLFLHLLVEAGLAGINNYVESRTISLRHKFPLSCFSSGFLK